MLHKNGLSDLPVISERNSIVPIRDVLRLISTVTQRKVLKRRPLKAVSTRANIIMCTSYYIHPVLYIVDITHLRNRTIFCRHRDEQLWFDYLVS